VRLGLELSILLRTLSVDADLGRGQRHSKSLRERAHEGALVSCLINIVRCGEHSGAEAIVLDGVPICEERRSKGDPSCVRQWLTLPDFVAAKYASHTVLRAPTLGHVRPERDANTLRWG
jgi:hypothetical protein